MLARSTKAVTGAVTVAALFATAPTWAGQVKFLDTITIYADTTPVPSSSGLVAYSVAGLDDVAAPVQDAQVDFVFATSGSVTAPTASYTSAIGGDFVSVNTAGSVTPSLFLDGSGTVDITATNSIEASLSTFSAGGSFSDFTYVAFFEVVDSPFTVSGEYLANNLTLSVFNISAVRTTATDPMVAPPVDLTSSGVFSKTLAVGTYSISFVSNLAAGDSSAAGSSSVRLNFAPAAVVGVPLPASALMGCGLLAPLMMRRRR